MAIDDSERRHIQHIGRQLSVEAETQQEIRSIRLDECDPALRLVGDDNVKAGASILHHLPVVFRLPRARPRRGKERQPPVPTLCEHLFIGGNDNRKDSEEDDSESPLWPCAHNQFLPQPSLCYLSIRHMLFQSRSEGYETASLFIRMIAYQSA
jgi:hypothetical protein